MPVICQKCSGRKRINSMGGMTTICPECKGVGKVADPKIMNAIIEKEKIYCDGCKKEIKAEEVFDAIDKSGLEKNIEVDQPSQKNKKLKNKSEI